MSAAWRQHRMDPILPKRPATCCRCGRGFETQINPPIHNIYGALVRGPRQVFRLCHRCRSDDGCGQEIGRKGEDARETC
jgi:hypothetical protein